MYFKETKNLLIFSQDHVLKNGSKECGGQFKMLRVKLLSKSTSTNAYRTPKAITKVVNERRQSLLLCLFEKCLDKYLSLGTTC